MISISRDVIALIRIITSCLTAGFLIFFISSLSGEDLIKNNTTIGELSGILLEINVELEEGINKRIKQLGEVPAVNPYKKFYCAELAKEIHEVSYLTEKQKILFDAYNVRDFEDKSKRLVRYSEKADMDNLLNELEIVKRELKNSANLIDKRRKKLVRQRTAYIILFFVLWLVLYFYYSRGIIKKYD
jgi:Fe2+ transport system protein B